MTSPEQVPQWKNNFWKKMEEELRYVELSSNGDLFLQTHNEDDSLKDAKQAVEAYNLFVKNNCGEFAFSHAMIDETVTGSDK